jgi:hypothetical protein
MGSPAPREDEMSAKPMQQTEPESRTEAERKETDPCAGTIDRNAPAGSPNSLGAKSDCNGRPSTDDSVVEAKDEMGPGVTGAGDR